MKLQDLHPFDSFIVGIKNIYYIDYKGNFHINAKFIIVANKTLSTGSIYVLIESFNGKKSIVYQVRLKDAYYDDGTINLIVQDIVSHEPFTIDQRIECTKDHYKWILIDIDSLVDELNTEVIKSYCDTCTDAEKESHADKNLNKLNNDLFEFDF